jgi:peroxiredoxin
MSAAPALQPKPSLLHTALLAGLVLAACQVSPPETPPESPAADVVYAREQAGKWDWFGIEMTDVQTGGTFSMKDFSGRVVLVETMAIWCPNCTLQANEVRKLHDLLRDPDDLISVTLDVDVNEDAASLKKYAQEFGFEWRFVVAPREVARALGNLYSAQYLNPPLSPMLLIDRQGDVHLLEYGTKSADALLEFVEPFLTP